KRVVTARKTPPQRRRRRGSGERSSLITSRQAAARRPISIPLAASENEQPQAAKPITVKAENSRSNRSSAQVRASNTVEAAIERTDSAWESAMAVRNEGLPSATSELRRNQETDEKPSTTSDWGVSATRP